MEQNKQYTTGYDYDGVSDHLPMAPNSVVITGRPKSDEKELRKNVGNVPIHFFPYDKKHTPRNVGLFKGEKSKELGLTRFYDDEDEVITAIKDKNPDIEVIKVDHNDIKFVTITSGWDGMPIAYHLALEGKESIIGQVQDFKELDIDKEDEEPKDKKQRLSQYDGMIKKYPARKVVDALKKIKNKDNYFIYCDQNNLFKYAEELLEAGFTKGIFPLKDDYEFEKDRERAMDFVQENYPDVKIIPHQKVKTVDEAKKLVEETQVPLVIQSQGDFVSTICPPDDLEINKAQILSALDKHSKEYAQGEIILKEKLIQPIEITPEIVFWDGEPVFTDIDIETKNIGDGENNGNQVGCGTNLIISTEMEEKINKIAFPPKVHHMAKKRKGIFIWDISLYITEKGIYFGEFCSNRFGYDCVMTEMAMSGGASNYFKAIMNKTNPLREKFGAALRVFNLNRQEDVEIKFDVDSTWLYEAKKKGDQIVSVGDCWDLGVITGKGEDVLSSIEEVYKNLDKLSFKERYTRTKEDFLSDYPTSIIHRYKTTNGTYFTAPDFENVEGEASDYDERLKLHTSEMRKEHEKQMGDMVKKHKEEMDSVHAQIKEILNA